jgi:hypothetical protein
MKTLEIKRIDNLEEARNAWLKLSPDKALCDNWDFRYCFYKYFNYPLYFYAGYNNGEIVGLLPLQFNEVNKQLEFFSGGFMRDNRVFVKQGFKECIPQFFEAVSMPADLHSIIGDDPYTKSMTIYKYKYVADISDINNIEDYFKKYFKAKTIKKIRKEINLIESLNYSIIENGQNDLNLMIELNIKSFGEKSSFNKPHRTEIFHDLLKLDLDIHLLTLVINGQKEAVSMYIMYKDTFIGINSGTNRNNAFNLGTYLNYIKFCKAIQLKAKFYDAGLSDLGWKEKWHLEKSPQYVFIKN